MRRYRRRPYPNANSSHVLESVSQQGGLPIMNAIFLLLILSLPLSSRAEEVWQSAIDNCSGLAAPDFHKNFDLFAAQARSGKVWEKNITQENSALGKIANESCPAYLANPNGHTALASFTKEFERSAENALELKKEADLRQIFFDGQYESARKYLSQFRIVFASAPCAQAMTNMKTFSANQVRSMENQFHLIQTKCPVVAQKIEATKLGQQKPVTRAKDSSLEFSSQKSPESDVTGLKEDMAKQRTLSK